MIQSKDDYVVICYNVAKYMLCDMVIDHYTTCFTLLFIYDVMITYGGDGMGAYIWVDVGFKFGLGNRGDDNIISNPNKITHKNLQSTFHHPKKNIQNF